MATELHHCENQQIIYKRLKEIRSPGAVSKHSDSDVRLVASVVASTQNIMIL